MEPMWRIELRCTNCRYEWLEGVFAGRRFERATLGGLIEVEDFASKYVRNVVCPRCKCEREVSRKDSQ